MDSNIRPERLFSFARVLLTKSLALTPAYRLFLSRDLFGTDILKIIDYS
jgi:hypothetical protein